MPYTFSTSEVSEQSHSLSFLLSQLSPLVQLYAYNQDPKCTNVTLLLGSLLLTLLHINAQEVSVVASTLSTPDIIID